MLSSCVRLFVFLSQAGTVTKWLNVESHKQLRTIAHGLLFSEAQDLGEIPMGMRNRGGVGSDQQFVTNIPLYLRNGAR